MGYLPRGYHDPACRLAGAERGLLGLDPAYRYLYYVGLGFWHGFRHARRPDRIERLAAHVEPLSLPLCYDGYGFKLGFFDFPADPAVARRLERCPDDRRRFAYQGFGRAQFFTRMDDPVGFRHLCDALPEYVEDLEFGRALARAFTGVDRAAALLRWLEQADAGERAARLVGTTWGLTARHACDPAYFRSCMAGTDPSDRLFLERLPRICEASRAGASDYADWQARTRAAVVAAWAER
jgi:hypothetical protein